MVERACMKERTVHGKKNFPLCVYRNVCNKQNVMDYHWHDEAEFIYLVSGNVTFYLDASPLKLESGEAIFVKSGQIHSGRMESPGSCEFYSIVFDMAMLDSSDLGESRDAYINPLIAKRYSLPRFYNDSDDKCGRYILNRLSSISMAFFEKAPAYELSIISSLYAIIARIAACGRIELESKIPDEWDNYKKDRFKHVLEYIHLNYKRKISVEDLAQQVNLSPFHFSRFFKTISGKTPVEYLNEYRIDQASHLLISSNDKIMDVAFDCGFSNFSYFIKIFKKIKGCTPSDYRKKVDCMLY
jgi:AraC-like DNA-binding protein/quercetin dioxygenase-like cupin family protein